MATRQLHWGHRGAFVSNATRYANPCSGGQSTQWTTAAQPQIWGTDGTFNNLSITLPTAPGVGNTVAFTLQINGVDTAVTVTIGGTSTTGSDTINAAPIVDGDTLNLKCVASASAVASAPRWALEFVAATGAGVSGYGVTDNLSAASTLYASPFGCYTWLSTTVATQVSLVAAPGSVTKLKVKLSGSPGTGKSYTFVMLKNGVVQDGSGGTANTTVTIADAATAGEATFTLACSGGDYLQTRCTPSGTPTVVEGSAFVGYTASNDGAFNLGGFTNSGIVDARFTTVMSRSTGWDNATESLFYLYGGISTVLLANLYVLQNGTSLGITYTIRINGADTAIQAVLASGSATGNDTTNGATLLYGDAVTLGASGNPGFNRVETHGLQGFCLDGLQGALQKVTQQVLLSWYNQAVEADPPPEIDPPDVGPCQGGGDVPSGSNPGAGEDLSTATAPIPWVAITVGATTYRYAAATIPHSPPRYGRVKSFGVIDRQLSEPDSGPKASTMTVELIDHDRALRAIGNTGTLKHALFEAFVSDVTTIVAEGTPFRVFRGRVSTWEAGSDLLFTIVAEDEFTARLTSIDAEDMAVGQTLLDVLSDQQPEELTFGKPAPEVYGNVSDEDEDEPKGVIELRHSSNITFPEAEGLGNNPVFPICVGPVGKVQTVFGGSPFEDPPVTRIKLPASAYGDWLWVVTQPGWFAPNDYWVDDSLQHRWALVVLKDGHPTAELARSMRIPLTANVCGYEAKGDATGLTINSIPKGFLHWLNARLLQDGTAGDSDWPTSIFAIGSHSLIDTTTFEAVHDILDGLNYKLGGVLGHDLQFESWRDRWARWLRHMGYDAATGSNRHGQLILAKLDRTNAYSSALAFDEATILDRGVRVQNRDDAVENVIRYVSQQNYRTKLQGLNPAEGERGLRDPYDGPWLYLPEPIEDSTSIGDLGGEPRGRRRSAIQEYGLTRDTATADGLAQERLDWLSPANGRAEIDFDLSLRHAWNIELGDVITVEHRDLVWSGAHRCQVRGLAWNLDTHEVTVTAWDVEDLLP